MRPHLTLSLALSLSVGACGLVACSSAKSASRPAAAADSTSGAHAAAPDAPTTPKPLRSCSTHELRIDGADVVLTANLDGSLAHVVVVDAPDAADRQAAIAAVQAQYGAAKPDRRTQYRAWHLGLPRLTDMCGRTIMPSPSPAPSTMASATPAASAMSSASQP